MMNLQDFITILTFSLPMFSAIVCCAFVFPYPGSVNNRMDRRIHNLLIAYFITAVFGWFSMIIYPFFPKLFVYIQSFTYLSFLLVQIFFYQFVFNITKLTPCERFSRWHYLLPVSICGILFIWSFFVPFDVQLEIVESKANIIPEGYEAYFRLFTSKPIGRFVFSLVYTALTLIRLMRYRRVVQNFSANDEQSSLRWLNTLIILAFGFLLMPAIAVIAGRVMIYTTLPSVFTSFIVATQHIILAYNTLKKRYLILEEADSDDIAGGLECSDEMISADNRSVGSSNKLVRDVFEEYIKTHKPYLNPNLRITDLAKQIGSNRTYLSSFINETYGMNFSCYINGLRLIELDRLKNNPANARIPLTQLVEMAGFGSYRNYTRLKEKMG